MRLESNNEVNKRDFEEVGERVIQFKKEEKSSRFEEEKNEIDNGFLQPPQSILGDMGKPVTLPANLSGKLILLTGQLKQNGQQTIKAKIKYCAYIKIDSVKRQIHVHNTAICKLNFLINLCIRTHIKIKSYLREV